MMTLGATAMAAPPTTPPTPPTTAPTAPWTIPLAASTVALSAADATLPSFLAARLSPSGSLIPPKVSVVSAAAGPRRTSTSSRSTNSSSVIGSASQARSGRDWAHRVAGDRRELTARGRGALAFVGNVQRGRGDQRVDSDGERVIARDSGQEGPVNGLRARQ